MLLILLILVIEEGRVVVLLHVLLGRLVDLVSGLLCSSLLGFLFLPFDLLDFLELLEDILVVEERVRELVHEDIASQEALDTALNDGHLQ